MDDPNSTPEQKTKAQKVLITNALELEGDKAKKVEEGDMEAAPVKGDGIQFYADADDRFTAMEY